MAQIKAPSNRPIQYRQASRGAIKAPPPPRAPSVADVRRRDREVVSATPIGRRMDNPYQQVGRPVLQTPAWGQSIDRVRSSLQQIGQRVGGAVGYAGNQLRQSVVPPPRPPNPRQYQYGYAPTPQYRITPNQMQYGPFGTVNYSAPAGWRPYPTTLPDTIQGQANRIVDQFSGSLYTDRRWGGEVGDFPYSPEMAYGRAPNYGNGGGGGGGYGGYGGYYPGGGGGGGGGGYTERAPEWYERMAQWSYGRG